MSTQLENCLLEARALAEKLLDPETARLIGNNFDRIDKVIKSGNADTDVLNSMIQSETANMKFHAVAAGDTRLKIAEKLNRVESSGLSLEDKLNSVVDLIEPLARVKGVVRPIETPISYQVKAAERIALAKTLDAKPLFDNIIKLAGGRFNKGKLDIANEIVADALIGKEVNTESGKLATAYVKAMVDQITELRVNLQKAGILVEDGMPLQPNFNMTKVISDREGFKAFLEDILDPRFHPDLDDVIDNIVKGTVSDAGSNAADYTISVTNRYRFKNVEAYKRAILDTQYSSNAGLHEMFVSEVSKLSRNLKLAEEFGAKPYAGMTELVNKAKSKFIEGGGSAEKAQAAVNRVESFIGEMHDDNGTITIPTAGSIFRSLRLIQVASKLSLTAIYGIQDIATVSASLIQSGGYKELAGVFTPDMLKGYSRQELREIMSAFGVVPEIFTGEILRRNGVLEDYTRGLMTGSEGPVMKSIKTVVGYTEAGASTMANVVIKAHFAEGIQKHMKTAATVGYLKLLSKFAGKSFTWLAENEPVIHSRLLESGIDSSIWAKVSKTEFMNKELGILDARMIMKTDRQSGEKLAAFLVREADMMVTVPNMGDDILARFGTNPKGISAGFLRTLTQFFNYSIAMVRSSYARSTREAFTVSGSKAKTNLGIYTALLLASGTGMVYARKVLSSKDEIDYAFDENTLIEILGRSELIPVIGNEVVAALRWRASGDAERGRRLPSYVGDVEGLFTGPSPETVSEIFRSIVTIGSETFGKETGTLAKDIIPFSNSPYGTILLGKTLGQAFADGLSGEGFLGDSSTEKALPGVAHKGLTYLWNKAIGE